MARRGRPAKERDWELEAARREVEQLTEAVKAQAIELALVRGESRLDLSGPPTDGTHPPVIGIVDKPTNRIAAIPVDRVKTDIVAGIVKQHVAAGASVYSDASQVYLWLDRLGYRHESVHHEHGEFARAR